MSTVKFPWVYPVNELSRVVGEHFRASREYNERLFSIRQVPEGDVLTGIQKVEFAIGTKWIDIITHAVMFVIGQSPKSIRVAIVEPAFMDMLSSKNNPLVVVDEIKRVGYGLHLSYQAHQLDRLAPLESKP